MLYYPGPTWLFPNPEWDLILGLFYVSFSSKLFIILPPLSVYPKIPSFDGTDGTN